MIDLETRYDGDGMIVLKGHTKTEWIGSSLTVHVEDVR